MHKPGLIWKIYGLYFTLLTVLHFVSFVYPRSPIFLFFQFLIGFHRPLLIIYVINIFGALLNILTLWPLYLFIFHRQRLRPRLWQTFFFLKILGDVFSNYFQFLTLKSFFHSDHTLAFQIFFGDVLTVLPSYIACFQYAFQQHKIFPNNK